MKLSKNVFNMDMYYSLIISWVCLFSINIFFYIVNDFTKSFYTVNDFDQNWTNSYNPISPSS